MNLNLNDAIRAAEAGDAKMLTVAMAAYAFGGVNYPAAWNYPTATMRELRDRFPAAHEEACSAKYYEAARNGTLDKLAPPAAKRTEPAPGAKDSRSLTSSWDEITLNRRLGQKAAAPEPEPGPASATSAWDEVIAMVNERYFKTVATNRGYPLPGNG
jgi:hypothetical protein